MRRRFAPPVALFVVCVLSKPAVAGPEFVHLERWQGKAVAVRNPGPGPKLFELGADVTWDKSAPKEASRYAVRVTLPDGQTTTRAIELEDRPGSTRLTVLVPALAVRNLRPDAVKLRATVVDPATGATLSNTLDATIEDFHTPEAAHAPGENGPFGWGHPLKTEGGKGQLLPGEGPGGFHYVFIPATDDIPAFYLATAEATVGQVGALLKDYDPKADRSDEFALEDADQPAIALTPARAIEALKALSRSDRAGVAYRLPTRAEWLRAAKAGRDSAFWWGDEPTHPEGANFLGPEPALGSDSTAPATPPESSPTFAANPWGLAHTFGNADEWATDPDGGFVRMGGHFRTEPASPLPDVKVEKAEEIGPDAYVGFRPAFSIDAETGTRLASHALANKAFAPIVVTYDPSRATVVLEGEVTDPSLRARADRRLRSLWFVAAVEDQVRSPSIAPGNLALLGMADAPARQLTPLARRVIEVPLAVRWADTLPVEGSEFFVNVYGPGGAHSSHALLESAPGASKTLRVLIDPPRGPVTAALSLGAPAPSPTDPRIVSNLVPLGTPRPAAR